MLCFAASFIAFWASQKARWGVPGVATESAELSIMGLQLPVRSPAGGRKSGWQHTCMGMDPQRTQERVGDQDTRQPALEGI